MEKKKQGVQACCFLLDDYLMGVTDIFGVRVMMLSIPGEGGIVQETRTLLEKLYC